MLLVGCYKGIVGMVCERGYIESAREQCDKNIKQAYYIHTNPYIGHIEKNEHFHLKSRVGCGYAIKRWSPPSSSALRAPIMSVSVPWIRCQNERSANTL